MITNEYNIIFNYKRDKLSIQGESGSTMKNILRAFKNKFKLNDINLRFEYEHEAINEEITLGEFVTKYQIKNYEIKILVIEENKDENKILSKEIICPECNQGASNIIITDDKVKFICSQNHCIEIPKNEFKKSQMLAQSKKKKYCLTCKESICSFWEQDHIKDDSNHLIIDEDEKDYLCLEHNNNKNPFIFYCKTCQKNLCWICWDYHKNHEIETLKEIYFFKDKLITKQKAYLSILKKFDQLFEELLKIRDNFKCTYEMNEIIINNYNFDNRNYIKLCNYKEIYEKNFNLQKINKMVTILSNITKINIDYQEINFNIDSNIIKKEEVIKVQNQEIKECNFSNSFNKSQILKLKNNIDISEKTQSFIEVEKQNDESVKKINNLKNIIPTNEKNNENENVNKNDKENLNGKKYENMKKNKNENEKETLNENANKNEKENFKENLNENVRENMNENEKENFNENKNEILNENEEQYNEDISESKVNNNTKNIESSDEIIVENNDIEKSKNISNIIEYEKNEDEKNINSCYKKESLDEQYNNGNKNNQRIKIENKIGNRIKIIYRIKGNKKKIKIFGKNFVKNNKDKCKFIYEDKSYDLTEKFDVKNNKKILEIYLEGIDKITDASEMFCDCLLLTNLEGISEWDTSNITNMSRMFMNCESLSFLDISKWNLVNVTNISYMFYGCKKLKKLPDLSGWNTSNITNMSHLFDGCESLTYMPDLSKWNFKNVTNMEYMFSECKSLKTLPDLSIWNINNVTNMSHLFDGCNSLDVVPDLSRWSINKVTDISYLFKNCESLKSLPDISKWSTNNIINMSHLFENCESLESMPDLSKLNVKNVKNMEYMFFNCIRLTIIKIPKKVYKVEDISYLYYGCISLKKEPDLKEWNLNKIKKKEKFNDNIFQFKINKFNS